jgi:hypothetical protein
VRWKSGICCKELNNPERKEEFGDPTENAARMKWNTSTVAHTVYTKTFNNVNKIKY